MSNSSAPLRCTLGARHLVPGRKSPRTEQPIIRRFQEVTPEAEQIVDRAMNREKPLGVARRFESPHLAFSLARGLMCHFGSVIRPFVLAVSDPEHKLPARRPIAAEFVGYQLVRDVLQPFQQFTKEAFRGVFIAALLHQDIQDITILIHRPPKIMLLASNRDTDFIEVPRIAQPPLASPQLPGNRQIEFQTPLAHRFVADEDPARKLRQKR